ncbi:hypothetical protein BD560DRAFT_72693 [Blakeslea trispora]|nr:hypothetical protein BD560DRAFT_72693 [Blakeslea trispora]
MIKKNKVGVALVGGLISCINRRGGCARRNNDKRSIEYEDFGLADTDFPPRQMPNMQSMTSDHVHTGQRFADATIPQLGPQGNHYHILPEEPHAQHQFEAKYLPPDEIGNEHQAYYYSHEQPVQHGAPTYYTNHNNYYSNY